MTCLCVICYITKQNLLKFNLKFILDTKPILFLVCFTTITTAMLSYKYKVSPSTVDCTFIKCVPKAEINCEKNDDYIKVDNIYKLIVTQRTKFSLSYHKNFIK